MLCALSSSKARSSCNRKAETFPFPTPRGSLRRSLMLPLGLQLRLAQRRNCSDCQAAMPHAPGCTQREFRGDACRGNEWHCPGPQVASSLVVSETFNLSKHSGQLGPTNESTKNSTSANCIGQKANSKRSSHWQE
eukprot:8007549-Pyramimonas_sp.AAC.1